MGIPTIPPSSAIPTTSFLTPYPTVLPTTFLPTILEAVLNESVSSTITFLALSITSFDSTTFTSTFRTEFTEQMAAAAAVPTSNVAVTTITAGSTAVSSIVYFAAMDTAASTSFKWLLASSLSSIFTYSSFQAYGPVSSSSISTSSVGLAPSLSPPPAPHPQNLSSSHPLTELPTHAPSASPTLVPTASPITHPPSPPEAVASTALTFVFEDLSMSYLSTNQSAHDAFVLEFKHSVAVEAKDDFWGFSERVGKTERVVEHALQLFGL
ncbi:hypothetical protein CYMTET_37560 [Cymbomonas tetramitiformis]|uniref:Uncharacterized protein n=1 Tax=Cymbomonas tetramitiformis TaxID=36881 RepID=A0AAE0CDP1_9CHLO|nr:hypothetical protein CYMTET_37560 [Cymbomonas tetramitiformis]